MPNGRRWFTAVLLFIAVSVAGLGIRPLIVPDEPRYGIIPAEMVESGNWLALRMNGFVYYEKPPLGVCIDSTRSIPALTRASTGAWATRSASRPGIRARRASSGRVEDTVCSMQP